LGYPYFGRFLVKGLVIRTMILNNLNFMVIARNNARHLGLYALQTPSMNVTVFWVVAPCSLVEVTDTSEVLAASIIRTIALYTVLYRSDTWSVALRGE
jgi:hypothetical protein